MNNTQTGDSVANSIRAIKAELRSAMNGIASRAIRESGMGYKLVFGVELPRLRQIAATAVSDIMQLADVAKEDAAAEARRLAIALWDENVRECKMLAILLYPREAFDNDIADIWISSLLLEQAELAQLLAMERLCHMPQAADQAFFWMADDSALRQLCGFLTLTRLLMQGAVMSPDAEAEFLDQAAATLSTDYLPLRKAVNNALLRFGESSDEAMRKVDAIL